MDSYETIANIAHEDEVRACDTGCEYVIDAFDCPAESLRDLARMQWICDEVITGLGLKVVGDPQWHQFPGPAGVTGLYLLSESHLACHTYPEIGFASFNLYCCRPKTDWPWREMLCRHLGAEDVTIRRLPRGKRTGEAQHEA